MSIIAKYKFDSSIYADLIPEFNAEFTSDLYTVTDEVDSENSNYIIRTIESDSLPTLMRFGSNLDTYVEGNELALLEVLDMDTSGLTSCYRMFRYCKNLTSITCEWNTSNVTNMAGMFTNCTNLTSLDVSNFDTSKGNNMGYMFNGCKSLTSLDLSNFDTSNVTRMDYMFAYCNNLTSLDVSNWDTSNVTSMAQTFDGCKSLTTLDVSKWDTGNVTMMQYMFNNCNKLTSLDVSNFDTSNVANMSNAFTNTSLLTDIGMIYCNQSTINKVASLLPTDIHRTIWVEDVDVKDLTSVEGVEFKQYAKNTEIMLTSPLLEGDKLIIKDGKLYHYHKMGMEVLDGSETWAIHKTIGSTTSWRYAHNGIKYDGNSIHLKCDKLRPERFNTLFEYEYENIISTHNSENGYLYVRTKHTTNTALKQWLSENPTTVVYELAYPYYELISEDPLTISLIAESSDITNSSNIPLNMTINNKGLATVAMKPSTTYTVAFDKDTDDEVVVNLCGNEVTTTDNIVEITTPSEIDDELIFYGDGIEISNVRLLEGSVSGDSVPRESFEGLKNSFEDNKLPKNMFNIDSLSIVENNDACIIYTPLNSIPLGIYTYVNLAKKPLWLNLNEYLGGNYITTLNIDSSTLATKIDINTDFKITNIGGRKSDGWTNVDTVELAGILLEGDWTHLTEEDFNHLGKYKVEYKVTGKNKFDGEFELGSFSFSTGDEETITNIRRSKNFMKVNGGEILALSSSNINADIQYIFEYNKNKEFIKYTTVYGKITLSDETKFIRFRSQADGTNGYTLPTENPNIQIEEGTVATEYEPYKEYTKTFYLNSPLLEGDTIEDVNGVATHVRRGGSKLLDGSEEGWYIWDVSSDFTNTIAFAMTTGGQNGVNEADNSYIVLSNTICDKFIESGEIIDSEWHMTHSNAAINSCWWSICVDKTKLPTQDVTGFKQWLSENPVTVVYQLASPIYEPISTESILCDSYVNGHLDFDSAVPIEKVVFSMTPPIKLNYLQSSANYIIKFESDNIGIVNCNLGANNYLHGILANKGINKIIINKLNTLSNEYLYFDGIGFNASNIQVVATDRDIDFDYFKGLQSSFEGELVTDETDENYGKYKVECKVIGKNKFDINEVINKISSSSYELNNNELTLKSAGCVNIPFLEGKFKENTQYMFSYNFSNSAVTNFFIAVVYTDGTDQPFYTQNTGKINRTSLEGKTIKHLVFSYGTKGETTLSNIQIEEGITPTPYEPYQEYTKTIYLNSPLLKGDTIEVHNGKLCHYHKMGMVVLDGSEYWMQYQPPNDTGCIIRMSLTPKAINSNILCDMFSFNHISEVISNRNGISTDNGDNVYIGFTKDKGGTLVECKQWLQANPTTVVYELAEPYYEEIEPTQEDLIITSVKEGDLHIDTIVPISSKVTYNVNVQLLTDFEQSIVEQVQATQTTDLQSILDEEIDN